MKLKLADVAQAARRMDGTGFCIACGAEHPGIEPDAREDLCEACGRPQVFGAEQIILEFAFVMDCRP